ncbi:MAG TPA: DUF983 domain-containing protein [Pseudonocardiaceae bacterium]|jgi:hypothetical protein|nr:DUF983 domain-containing protein [Pseudonocardiaceae bacterium]
MTRTVRVAGRWWSVRASVNWSEPVTAREFEHDVAAGGMPGAVMLVLVVVMMLTVVLWTPAGVVVPTWLVVAFLLLLLLLPVLWATGRSWTIVAETPALFGEPPERWVGTVHGMTLARQHLDGIARTLQRDGILDDGNGPLERVNCGPLQRVN